MLPEQFGRYRIQKRLGQGGMGSVYLAYDTALDRRVALKVPHFNPDDGPEVLERFYREGRACAKLEHPNLCQVYDVGSHEGVPYLTMAFIDGKTLAEVLKGSKGLPQREAATIVCKLALALQEAHTRGVIHRDLKPSNVMINHRGEPVLMDFGLARRLDADSVRLTRVGEVMGTPAYMPPEQVNGEINTVGPPCDIYSLGVILYELLTGRQPFGGSMAVVLAQILTQKPQPPSVFRAGIDPRLEAVCLRAMQKQIGARYANMAEFAAALLDYLRTSAVQGVPAPIPIKPILPAKVVSPREPRSDRTAPLPVEAVKVAAVPIAAIPIGGHQPANVPQVEVVEDNTAPLDRFRRDDKDDQGGKGGRLLVWVVLSLLVLAGLVVALFLLFHKPDPHPEVPRVGGKAVGEWAEALKDPDARVRDEAAAALVGAKGDAVPVVAALLKDGKIDVRLEAIQILKKIGASARPGVPELLHLLQDPDARVRETAIVAIGEICGRARAWDMDVVAGLCRSLMKDAEPRVKFAAAAALGGVDRAVPEVDAAMAFVLKADDNILVRQQVAMALGRMGERGVVNLRAALKDEAPQVRIEAIKSASSLSEDAVAETMPELSKCAADDDRDVRRTAVAALARVAGPRSRQAWEPLMKALQDPDLELKRNAVLALGNIGRVKNLDAPEVIASLIETLQKGDLPMRRRAAKALGSLGWKAESALPELSKALTDPDDDLGLAAALAINEIPGRDAVFAIETLTDALKKDDLKMRRRAALAFSYIKLPDRSFLPDLRKGLTDPDAEMRLSAAAALGRISEEAAPAIAALIGFLKTGNTKQRREAALALGRIGPAARDAVNALRLGLTDDDEETRSAVVRAFSALRKAGEQALPDLVTRLADKKESLRVRAQAAAAMSHMGFVAGLEEVLPRLLEIAGDKGEKVQVRRHALWPVRVYLKNSDNRELAYKTLQSILGEKTKGIDRLRYDAAYLLAIFQTSAVPESVIDVLQEFLKDGKVKIYSGRDDWGHEEEDIGVIDGRIRAVEALGQIGAARVGRHAEIVNQLRTLDADPATTGSFSARLKKLLADLGELP
jgi:serine/threonine protein kinase/HEAT repeat protein